MDLSCLENVPPSNVVACPGQVNGNFGLNAAVRWFWNTESRALFVLHAKKMRTTLVTFPLNARP